MIWRIRLRGKVIWQGEMTYEDVAKVMATFFCLVDSGYREIALVYSNDDLPKAETPQ